MHNYWTLMKKLIWLKILQGASFIVETITGDSPITLTNSINSTIVSFKQYGKCIQNGTPTPSTPVDIVCNNGALCMVDDELPAAYKRVLGFTCDNNALWEISGFHLRGSDTVRISFSVDGACNVFGCYQGADATDNYDLYVSTTSGSKYFRYGNGTYASYWSSSNLGQRFDVVFTPTGSQGMPQDSTWTEKTFESANDMLIGSTTTTGTSSKLRGNLYGEIIVDGRLKLIPCERQSDGVLGYYDTYSGTFFEPYTGFTGAVSLGYDGSHYSLAVVVTDEVLTVSATGADPQTITDIPMLLSVGDYADEAEIISGGVKRKVGIKVLDGTENYARRSDYAINFIEPGRAYGNGIAGICTHFQCIVGNSMHSPVGTLLFNMSNNYIHFFTEYGGDVAAFKAWLAAQYAVGTPIIVIYPLAEETEEHITAHTLHSHEGTTIVDAQTEVDPVKLEVSYKTKSA